MNGEQLSLIANGIGDDPFNRCLAVGTSVFGPMFSVVEIILHSDMINWLLIELIILFPLFFRLYGFGFQNKITEFYFNTRQQLIIAMSTISLATVLCSMLQFYCPQPSACVYWNGLSYEPYKVPVLNPNNNIVCGTLLACTLVVLGKKSWLLRGLICFLVTFFIYLASLLCGAVSLNQCISSISLGVWLFFFFRILSPFFALVVNFIFAIAGFVIFIIPNVGADYAYKETIVGIRGCLLLVLLSGLYIRFCMRQPDFKWFKLNINTGPRQEGIDMDGALIPRVRKAAEMDTLGSRLTRDIIEGAIAFLLVIIADGIIGFFYDYQIMDVG